MMCYRCPADAEARGGEPYQLPGQRHPGHPGHPWAHQAAERRGPGGRVPGRHVGPPAQQEGGQPPRHHEQPLMVAALVRAISNTNDPESSKGAVGTLHNLFMHKQGLLAIFK